MRILMLGTDRRAFDRDSDIWKRLEAYGELLEALQVIVYTTHREPHTLKRISPRVTVYPTQSRTRLSFFRDAFRIGRGVIEGAPGSWVVTAQDPFETGFAAYRLTRALRVPLHLQLHTDPFSPYFEKESLLNRIRTCVAKFLLPKATRVRVVSVRVRDRVLALGVPVSNIDLLPIYVPSSEKRIICTDERFKKFTHNILMLSRLTKEKNIPLALRAFARVEAHRKNAALWIVGAGPEEKKLRYLANRLGIANNVFFEGWTATPENYYACATLFLLTSDYEGYGRTPIEALEYGVPVLMTDVGVAQEILNEKNGIIIAPRNMRALCNALEKVLSGSLPVRVAERLKNPYASFNDYARQFVGSLEKCQHNTKN